MTPTQIGAAEWLFSDVASTTVNEQSVTIHAIVEIVDMEESVGGQFEKPHTVDISLLPDERHLSSSVKEDVVDTYGADVADYEPFMLYGYGYHIPVNPEDTRLGGETNASNNLTFDVEGHNPCFEDPSDAKEYITTYLPAFFADLDIEACLSQRVNQAGDTGHSILSTICD